MRGAEPTKGKSQIDSDKLLWPLWEVGIYYIHQLLLPDTTQASGWRWATDKEMSYFTAGKPKCARAIKICRWAAQNTPNQKLTRKVYKSPPDSLAPATSKNGIISICRVRADRRNPNVDERVAIPPPHEEDPAMSRITPTNKTTAVPQSHKTIKESASTEESESEKLSPERKITETMDQISSSNDISEPGSNGAASDKRNTPTSDFAETSKRSTKTTTAQHTHTAPTSKNARNSNAQPPSKPNLYTPIKWQANSCYIDWIFE